jgi:hypothetical protein
MAVASGSAVEVPRQHGPSGAPGSTCSPMNRTSSTTWRSRRPASCSCHARWVQNTSTPAVRAWRTTAGLLVVGEVRQLAVGLCGDGAPAQHRVAEPPCRALVGRPAKAIALSPSSAQPRRLVAPLVLDHLLQAHDVGRAVPYDGQDRLAPGPPVAAEVPDVEVRTLIGPGPQQRLVVGQRRRRGVQGLAGVVPAAQGDGPGRARQGRERRRLVGRQRPPWRARLRTDPGDSPPAYSGVTAHR